MNALAAKQPRPSRCLLSFGANIGNPIEAIRQAADLLSLRVACAESGLRLSRLFRTPPIGGPSGQPPFINAVAAIETLADPWQMWQCIRQIERELGRERNQRWEARKIDLDILLFDSLRVWTPHLKIPHPRMVMRRFILLPSLDVAAEWREPVTGMSIQQLADNLCKGAASLVLIAGSEDRPEQLLQQAARQTMASWIDPVVETIDQHNPHVFETDRPPSTGIALQGDRSRWVGQISSDVLETDASIKLNPQPKLCMFLADPVANDGVAWEDNNRQLAQRMGLMESSSDPTVSCWPLAGPRYLLANDDSAWTAHEIVAALEAMDCPIEPISAH